MSMKHLKLRQKILSTLLLQQNNKDKKLKYNEIH